MKVFITGGAGFIGSHLVEALQKRAEKLVVLDDLSSGYRKNLDGLECEFVEGSITDRELVRRSMTDCDIVFHLAAEVSVAKSIHNPLECLNRNGTGLLNVLETAKELEVRKVIFASSAAVYGDSEVSPKCETMKPEPKSPYAVTKLDGEYYLDIYKKEFGLNYSAMRFFNVYGVRQDPNGPYAAAIPIFIEKAKRGEKIVVYGDGEQTRDFIHVSDVVKGLIFAAENEGLQGVYNLAGGKEISLNHLIRRICDIVKADIGIEYGPPRPGDIRHSCANTEKLSNLGFTTTVTLDEGLKTMLPD
ncbi:MAG: NAD-dependent epimerase/dehydratase family protein [Luteolibacter sp.]